MMGFFGRFAREEWNLGVVRQTIDDIVRYGIQKPVIWFPRNPMRLFADPFCARNRAGSVTILAEMMNHWIGKGEIWSATVRPGDDPLKAHFRRQIAGPAHLSYPFLMSNGGETYATMESHEAGGLFLWRRDRDQWRYVKAILNRPAVDPTFYRDTEFWWLFCTFEDDKPN